MLGGFPVFSWGSGRVLWVPGAQMVRMGEKRAERNPQQFAFTILVAAVSLLDSIDTVMRLLMLRQEGWLQMCSGLAPLQVWIWVRGTLARGPPHPTNVVPTLLLAPVPAKPPLGPPLNRRRSAAAE